MYVFRVVFHVRSLVFRIARGESGRADDKCFFFSAYFLCHIEKQVNNQNRLFRFKSEDNDCFCVWVMI